MIDSKYISDIQRSSKQGECQAASSLQEKDVCNTKQRNGGRGRDQVDQTGQTDRIKWKISLPHIGPSQESVPSCLRFVLNSPKHKVRLNKLINFPSRITGKAKPKLQIHFTEKSNKAAYKNSNKYLTFNLLLRGARNGNLEVPANFLKAKQ
jgi:hypothetical protein